MWANSFPLLSPLFFSPSATSVSNHLHGTWWWWYLPHYAIMKECLLTVFSRRHSRAHWVPIDCPASEFFSSKSVNLKPDKTIHLLVVAVVVMVVVVLIVVAQWSGRVCHPFKAARTALPRPIVSSPHRRSMRRVGSERVLRTGRQWCVARRRSLNCPLNEFALSLVFLFLSFCCWCRAAFHRLLFPQCASKMVYTAHKSYSR